MFLICCAACLLTCHTTEVRTAARYVYFFHCITVFEGRYRPNLGLRGLCLPKKQSLPGSRNNLLTAHTNHTHTPDQLSVPRSHRRFSRRPVTQAAPTVRPPLSLTLSWCVRCSLMLQADSQSIWRTVNKCCVEVPPCFKCHRFLIQRSSEFESRTFLFIYLFIFITPNFLSSYRQKREQMMKRERRR